MHFAHWQCDGCPWPLVWRLTGVGREMRDRPGEAGAKGNACLPCYWCKRNQRAYMGQWAELIYINYGRETVRAAACVSAQNYFRHARSQWDHSSCVLAVLNFLKNLVGSSASPPSTPGPVAYPRPMAELAEYLILLQTAGTAPQRGRNGNLLRLAMLLGEDPYCLGYLHGMFDSLCEQWEVPAAERRLVVGTASTILFRDLLDDCCDPRTVGKLEDAAFNGLVTHAAHPAFLRGKFDGCTELTRYTATGEQADMPCRLHAYLRKLAEAA